MRVLDPGHYYELGVLDADVMVPMHLRFVKREGEKYPGNVGSYPGTTMQEVLRAVIDRLKYVDKQIPDHRNEEALEALAYAIWWLEARAAERHGRLAPAVEEAVYGKPCLKCLHVGCEGGCH